VEVGGEHDHLEPAAGRPEVLLRVVGPLDVHGAVVVDARVLSDLLLEVMLLAREDDVGLALNSANTRNTRPGALGVLAVDAIPIPADDLLRVRFRQRAQVREHLFLGAVVLLRYRYL